MLSDTKPRHVGLRLFLTVDATLLFFLGAALILVPDKAQIAFRLQDFPATAAYVLGLLGCVFFTLGIGYAVAATDPLRHVVWIWIGIARASLETLFGIACIARGIVTWPQASFGIIIAAIVAVGYIALYPRSEKI